MEVPKTHAAHFLGLKLVINTVFFTKKLEKSKKADFPYMGNEIFRKKAKYLAKYLAFFRQCSLGISCILPSRAIYFG